MEQGTSATSATITIGDATIPTEIRFLRISDLRYYMDNPRIFSILKQLGPSISQEEIEKQLWEQDSTKDLYRDIKQNGGLIEEVIVRDNEVLEGNSRLCAYRHLLKQAQEKRDAEGIKKWELIRAKILPKATDDRTVFAILGVLHIRGKAEWRPYEQASYLFRQATTYRMSPRELATQIGHSEGEVKTLIEAYKLMEKYKVTDPNRFSYFAEFASSRKLAEIKECIPAGMDLAEKFSEWVKEERIPRAEAVRDLATILKYKSSRAKFLNGQMTFEEALEAAKDQHPEATSSFYSKLRKATEAMKEAEEPRIREEILVDSQKKNIIRDLYKTAKRFAKSVGIEIEMSRKA